MSPAAPDASTRRLARPEASGRSRHFRAGLTVALLATIALTSPTFDTPWNSAIALLAAGAGAGYSLSGSV